MSAVEMTITGVLEFMPSADLQKSIYLSKKNFLKVPLTGLSKDHSRTCSENQLWLEPYLK